MAWTLKIAAFVACVLCVFLGVVVGINLNPTSATRYVLALDALAWGSVGDWLSGGGSLAAVVIALMSTRALSKAEVESLQLKQEVYTGLIIFEIVSMGRLPVYIERVFVESSVTPGKRVDLAFYYGARKGPVRKKLEHRESLKIGIPTIGKNETFAMEMSKTLGEGLETARVTVVTTIRTYQGKDFTISEKVSEEIRASVSSR